MSVERFHSYAGAVNRQT